MIDAILNAEFLTIARSDGMAVTLSPLSKWIVGGLFLVVLSAVVWVISYRKPDGAAYPEDADEAQPRD